MSDHNEPKTDAAKLNEPTLSQTSTVADGGLKIREFDDVRHSNVLARAYSTPPGGRIYAYRSDDDDHHIVVSRGDEPGTRWEKRVPATVQRPIPGQTRWTIPENWEQRIISNRDKHPSALFYVPDSEVWAHVSIPSNDHLTDAWYRVKTVGDLNVNPVGTLQNRSVVRQLANDYERDHGTDAVEDDAEAIREIARNWGVVKEELERTTAWVQDEGLDQLQSGNRPIHANDDFEIEFHQDRIFQPGEIIQGAVDLSEYDVSLSVLVDQLQNADLLPSYYRFGLTLDASNTDMEYYVRGLIEAGTSPAEAVDYYMGEIKGMTQTEWGKERGVDQSTISGNVSQATKKIRTDL